MDNENLEKLSENAIDIAEALIFNGGGHETRTEPFEDFLDELDIQVESNLELADLLTNCQSSVEQAIYDWVKKKRGNKENQ
jgi:hypothetical protein